MERDGGGVNGAIVPTGLGMVLGWRDYGERVQVWGRPRLVDSGGMGWRDGRKSVGLWGRPRLVGRVIQEGRGWRAGEDGEEEDGW